MRTSTAPAMIRIQLIAWLMDTSWNPCVYCIADSKAYSGGGQDRMAAAGGAAKPPAGELQSSLAAATTLRCPAPPDPWSSIG